MRTISCAEAAAVHRADYSAATVQSATRPGPDDWRRARRAAVAEHRRRRRTLAIDLGLGVLIAVVILVALPGLGVVAWFALPLLALGLLWIGVESLVRRAGTRRRRD